MRMVLKIFMACMIVFILSACRERISEVSTTDIQQLLTTGDAQYAQVNDQLYITKSILQAKNEEIIYPQYRTGKVNRDEIEDAIRDYEGKTFNITSSAHGEGIDDVMMSTEDNRIYTFVSGINLLQLTVQTDNGDTLRALAESVVNTKKGFEDELSNFDKNSAQALVTQFMHDVVNIEKSTMVIVAVTAEELAEQKEIVDKELSELGGSLKSDDTEIVYQDGYYVRVTPFIQDLPQFSDDVVLSEDDPTTSAHGAQLIFFVTKDGIQSAHIVRLLPQFDNPYGETSVGNYDSKAIEQVMMMMQTNLSKDTSYIEKMELIYFPIVNRQEKESEIYFTPVWRFVVRSGDNVQYIYLDPETYKEIL